MTDRGPKEMALETPFLFHPSEGEQTLNLRMVLLGPGKVLSKSSDGAEKEFIPVPVHKIIERTGP